MFCCCCVWSACRDGSIFGRKNWTISKRFSSHPIGCLTRQQLLLCGRPKHLSRWSIFMPKIGPSQQVLWPHFGQPHNNSSCDWGKAGKSLVEMAHFHVDQQFSCLPIQAPRVTTYAIT